MRVRWKRWSEIWPLWIGFLGGYVAWDIVDHTLLEPRHQLLGGLAVDWGIAALAGLATLLISQRRRSSAVAALPAEHGGGPAVVEHIAGVAHELNAALQQINAEVGAAMGLDGTEQGRALRRAMLATHEAQSLLDEIAGLSARPRVSGPPPPQEFHDPAYPTNWE